MMQTKIIFPTSLVIVFFLFLGAACAKQPVDVQKNTPSTDLVLPQKPEIIIPKEVFKGDPFIVEVKGDKIKKVTISWLQKKLPLIPGKNGQPDNSCFAVLAIPLKTTQKALSVSVVIETETGHETRELSVRIKKKDFPIQKLTVDNKYVTPPKETLERIRRDQKEVRTILATITPEKYAEYPFLRPVPGKTSSPFGVRRVFNGQERNPHRGLDFDAKTGDPIQACANGVIVLAKEHYYGGNTVIIDHGLGVYTLYLHLSEFNVIEGQQIKRSDTIGKIGSTGRVTGPHLHLALGVLGESVNAAPMIEGMQE